jgi:hypothetical protein
MLRIIIAAQAMRQVTGEAALQHHESILAESSYLIIWFAAVQLQINSNAAITRAGSIARFERRACSGVGLIA